MDPKSLIVISDPNAAKILIDSVRRDILDRLMMKEMSASDLVNELEKGYSSIAYQLKILEDAGFIKKVREEVVQKKIQYYYRATAYNYQISYFLNDILELEDQEFKEWRQNLMDQIIDGFILYRYSVNKEERPRVKELVHNIWRTQRRVFEEFIENRDTSITSDRVLTIQVNNILSDVELSKNEEYSQTVKELATLIKKAK